MAQVNLGYLKITPKNIFDPKKHFHPFFLYVNLPLRLFKTQIKTFHIFSQKLLIAPLVHHCAMDDAALLLKLMLSGSVFTHFPE